MNAVDRRLYFFPFVRASAEWNMKRDVMLFESFFRDRSGFRLYGWKERCVTVGRNREFPETTLEVARRPTGGGVVFHSYDIAFSFFINDNSPLWHSSVMDTYFEVSEIIRNLLIKKGFEVKYPEGAPEGRREMCFERAESHELVINGRKVVGCALLKRGKRFLAQGTIYLTLHPAEMERELCVLLKDRGFEIIEVEEEYEDENY